MCYLKKKKKKIFYCLFKFFVCISFSLSMLPFAIVEFINSGGLAVIPTKWFIGPEEDECYWPPARTNMAKAVIEQQDPHTDWATYKLTVKRKVSKVSICMRLSDMISSLLIRFKLALNETNCHSFVCLPKPHMKLPAQN